MKHKTSELTGMALDLAVAMIDPQCEGLTFKTVNGAMCGVDSEDGLICIYFLPDERALSAMRTRRTICEAGGEHARPYSPSTQWERGGPLIERKHIDLRYTFTEGGYRTNQSVDAVHAKIELPNGATKFDPLKVVWEYGPTPLVAAMRCYVASNLGDTVDIPD